MWTRQIPYSRAVRRTRHGPVILLGFCLAGSFLASCHSSRTPASPSATLRIGVGLGTGIIRSTGTSFLRDLLYAEQLLSFSWNGRPVPRLATFQWEPTNKILTLKLARGVRLHDGRVLEAPFVADVLKAAIQGAQAKKSSGGFVNVVEVRATDDSTIEIRLSEPDAFLLNALANVNIVDPKNPDIGTGPFRLVTREPVEVVRNPYYYQGQPGIDRVVVVNYDTPRGVWTALMRGEIDGAQDVPREAVEFLERSPDVRTSTTLRPYYVPLVFNVNHPILKQVEVRRALSEAVDRDEIVRKAMAGHGRIAEDPIWPDHWAYTVARRHYAYDPDSARRRLEAAGMPARRGTDAGTMPSRLRFTCLFYNEDPRFERIALYLQRQFADIGVDMDLEPANGLTLLERIKSNRFEAYLFQVGAGRSFDLLFRFWHSPPGDIGDLQNSGYRGADEVLERLRRTQSDDDIRTLVGDLRQQFFDDAPAVFISWLDMTRAVDARIDIGDRNDPDAFSNLWRWRPAESRSAAR
jgi:peptide/nickel transport system substrate-binding protein